MFRFNPSRGTRAMAAALAVVLAAATAAVSAAPSVSKSTKVGPGVYEVAVSPSTGIVYVASVGGGPEKAEARIFGFDPVTLAVKQTIPLGDSPAYGLGLNDRTQTLYTSNTRNGTVSAIDLKTSKVVATISEPDNPKAHLFRVLVDEADNKVYVSLTEGKIWVIDGATNTMSHILEGAGKTTIGLALDPERKRLYAANRGSNDVAVYDLESRKVVARIPTGGEASSMLALDGRGRRLFVTNQQSNDISVLDLEKQTVIKTIKTDTQALGLGYNPSTNQVYVANRQGGNVTVIDADKLEVVSTLAAGSLPNTVAIDSKSNRVYVTSKAKTGPRGAPPVVDPNGDTLTLIVP